MLAPIVSRLLKGGIKLIRRESAASGYTARPNSPVPREEVYVHASTGYASSLPMAKGQDVRNR